ncbi:hypothetical protein B566_EDAN015759 [Ephemera danica]|nr:hypothetical protein B566_EDAN015759 [Ephemera danica]
MQLTTIFLFFTLILTANTQRSLTNLDDLLNSCIKGLNHKSLPGPEAELFHQCKPWEKRSCCTYNTTRDAHEINLYKFNFNHCGPNLSPDCKRHFMQDFCFYECSPNVGPWVVEVNMKTRKERFFGVPLCQSDCTSWFNSCRRDFTCASNWLRNFNWSSGENRCMENAKCNTFENIFETANNFCEQVWDGSWKVVPDTQACMRMWFDPSRGNPNDQVARLRADEIIRMNNGAISLDSSIKITGFILFMAFHIYI